MAEEVDIVNYGDGQNLEDEVIQENTELSPEVKVLKPNLNDQLSKDK